MDGHSVRIAHGYGDTMSIYLSDAKLKLRGVKSYCVKGEAGKVPELTVTMDLASIIYGAEDKPDPAAG